MLYTFFQQIYPQLKQLFQQIKNHKQEIYLFLINVIHIIHKDTNRVIKIVKKLLWILYISYLVIQQPLVAFPSPLDKILLPVNQTRKNPF